MESGLNALFFLPLRPLVISGLCTEERAKERTECAVFHMAEWHSDEEMNPIHLFWFDFFWFFLISVWLREVEAEVPAKKKTETDVIRE